MLGLCTGFLPVAAAAMAKDTSELRRFGLEIIAIAMRLAQEITLRSRLIEEGPASWAYTVVGATVEESQAVLNRFHQDQVCFFIAMGRKAKLTDAESPSS